MGIPIGWNIAREEARSKDVLRADVTGQRSPIRRRLRPSRSPRPHSAFDTDFLVSTASFVPQTESVSRPSHARTRLPPPPVPEVSRSAYRSGESARDPPSLQREDASFRRQRARLDGFMRAYETQRALDSERPIADLTPNFAPAVATRTADGDVFREAHDSARRTNRSTFRRSAEARVTRSRSPRADQSASRRGDTADAVEDGHDSSDSNAVGFPPLRRMGRRTIADGPLPASSLRESWSPVSTMDGLGDRDRDRSLSPYTEQLPWVNFDTTIVPDPVAPTAESSFASAAASASFSNSHPSSRATSSNTSASSSRTHLTVPSRRHSPPSNEQFMRACDTSEDDTASDTEAEEDDAEATAAAIRQRYNPVTLRRRSRLSYFTDEPPHRVAERYSRRVLDRARDSNAYIRSFYGSDMSHGRLGSNSEANSVSAAPPIIEQLDGPIDGPAPASDEVPPFLSLNSPPLDQELREARSLLERLSRREDVSDDFWASVGLTRSFADRVESFNERDQL
jgi:hypothetical protein